MHERNMVHLLALLYFDEIPVFFDEWVSAFDRRVVSWLFCDGGIGVCEPWRDA